MRFLLYVYCQRGFPEKPILVKLLRSLYGLKQAGELWYKITQIWVIQLMLHTWILLKSLTRCPTDNLHKY